MAKKKGDLMDSATGCGPDDFGGDDFAPVNEVPDAKPTSPVAEEMTTEVRPRKTKLEKASSELEKAKLRLEIAQADVARAELEVRLASPRK